LTTVISIFFSPRNSVGVFPPPTLPTPHPTQVLWQVDVIIKPEEARVKKKVKIEPKESDDPSPTPTNSPAPIESASGIDEPDEIDANNFKDVVEVESVWWGAQVDYIKVASEKNYLAEGRIIYDNFRTKEADVRIARLEQKTKLARRYNIEHSCTRYLRQQAFE